MYLALTSTQCAIFATVHRKSHDHEDWCYDCTAHAQGVKATRKCRLQNQQLGPKPSFRKQPNVVVSADFWRKGATQYPYSKAYASAHLAALRVFTDITIFTVDLSADAMRKCMLPRSDVSEATTKWQVSATNLVVYHSMNTYIKERLLKSPYPIIS